MKLRIYTLSLIISYSLNPKNHPIEYFPHSANSSNVLWIRILCLRQTRKGVESTKLSRYKFSAILLDEDGQRKQYLLLQFHNVFVGHQTWEKVFQMFANIFLVIMLETVETTGWENSDNRLNVITEYYKFNTFIVIFLIIKWIYLFLYWNHVK